MQYNNFLFFEGKVFLHPIKVIQFFCFLVFLKIRYLKLLAQKIVKNYMYVLKRLMMSLISTILHDENKYSWLSSNILEEF